MKIGSRSTELTTQVASRVNSYTRALVKQNKKRYYNGECGTKDNPGVQSAFGCHFSSGARLEVEMSAGMSHPKGNSAFLGALGDLSHKGATYLISAPRQLKPNELWLLERSCSYILFLLE